VLEYKNPRHCPTASCFNAPSKSERVRKFFFPSFTDGVRPIPASSHTRAMHAIARYIEAYEAVLQSEPGGRISVLFAAIYGKELEKCRVRTV
jgi:hypothetical protein